MSSVWDSGRGEETRGGGLNGPTTDRAARTQRWGRHANEDLGDESGRSAEQPFISLVCHRFETSKLSSDLIFRMMNIILSYTKRR